MKKIILPAVYILFLCLSTLAQDSLVVTINNLTTLQGVIIKYNDGIPLPRENAELKVKSNPWQLVIHPKPGIGVTKVIIQNTSIPITSVEITDFSKKYTVENNVIREMNYTLGKNFRIVIPNNTATGILYTINYSSDRQAGDGGDSTLAGRHHVGSAIYDALVLADPEVTVPVKLGVLAYYSMMTDTTELYEHFKSNKFLDSLVKSLQETTKQNSPVSFASIFSSLGGLDVTKIADGFAKFLVKRTKQELSAAFFERFKETIEDPRYVDLQTVFPQTYRSLLIIDEDIYNIEAFIQTLRESFENDLSTLDENLPSIIDNHPAFFSRHPELAATLNSAMYFARSLADKMHPGEILKDYPTEYLDNLKPNWKGSIQTLQLLSASLRDTTASTDSVYWVSTSQIKKVVSKPAVFKIYLGLVFEMAKKEEYDSIRFNDGRTLIGFLNVVADRFTQYYEPYKNFVYQLGEKVNKLNRIIRNYRKPANDSLAFEQYYTYFESSVNLLEYSMEISKLPYIGSLIPDLHKELKDYFSVTHSAADLILDIKRRNYGSAVNNAVNIYDLVRAKYAKEKNESRMVDRDEKIKEKIATDVDNLLEKSSIPITNAVIDSLKEKYSAEKEKEVRLTKTQEKAIRKNVSADLVEIAGKDSIQITSVIIDSLRQVYTARYNSAEENDARVKDNTVKKMYKFGTFMASVVQAKSSDEVQQSIEAFALPSGSSRIKRRSDFNVSLNAYVGVFAGFERINGIDSKFKINSYGVTAPAGVAVSWGNRKLWLQKGGQWSYSVFISLIDIGAVAAFRFKDTVKTSGGDTLVADKVPTIQLRDIISPGVFLSIGIPKSPISLNFGAQMGSSLRKINIVSAGGLQPKNDLSNNTYWRFSASVCVDIPILNFHTR